MSVSRRRGVENQPNFKIGVKATKVKNVWLIVGANEVQLSDRASDYYVLTRIGLYPNHFVRLVKGNPKLEALRDIIPSLGVIESYVVGFCAKTDLQGPVKVVDKNPISPSYVRRSGELRTDWKFLGDNV